MSLPPASTSQSVAPKGSSTRPLNVLLTAFGSPGDVFPFVAIGAALRQRGHDVALIANAYYESAAKAAGVPFVPAGDATEYQAMLDDPELWSPRNGLRTLMQRGGGPAMRKSYPLIVERIQDGRTVLLGSSHAFAARLAQDKLGVPTATVHVSGANIITAYDGGVGKSLVHYLPLSWRPKLIESVERKFFEPVLAPPINAYRAELGLPPVERVQSKWIHSPLRVINAFPEWFFPPQPDWPPQTQCTGFIQSDGAAADVELPLDLVRFLDAGEPPVAIVPSSGMIRAKEFLQQSLVACKAISRRAVVVTARRDALPARLPEWAVWTPYAPYRLLFPRCAAVIHHGAIGTAVLALLAGTPQVSVPQYIEQQANAARLASLRIASRIDGPRYSARAAAAALHQVWSGVGTEGATEYARRVREARPLDEICALVEELPERAAQASAVSSA